MKNFVYLILTFLCLSACQEKEGYKITVNIDGLPDGLKVYLTGDGREVLDSTVTSGGQCFFEGRVDYPIYADIDIKTPGEPFSGRVFSFFLENSDIQVKGEWEKWSKIEITGSALEDKHEGLENQLKPLYRKLNREIGEQEWRMYSEPLHNGTFTVDCMRSGVEIAKQKREIERQVREIVFRFIKENPTSPVTLKLVADQLRNESRFTVQEVDELVESLSPELKQTGTFKMLEKKIETYRKTALGEKYIDFRVADVDGKEGKFSDYVQPGKYNLLEVWASWCGYCREEIPHLKIVQEKYGDRFNIIAVSIDKNEDEWRQAMNEENANYLQLHGLKDEEGNSVGDLYGFRGIPYSLVIDGEGRIVTVDGRGVKLDLLLEELYKE